MTHLTVKDGMGNIKYANHDGSIFWFTSEPTSNTINKLPKKYKIVCKKGSGLVYVKKV